MEKYIALLIADLTGYSAVTEMHGAQKAVEIIQQYEDLVFRSLTGESFLLERVGDQVIVISPEADDIARTALKIQRNARVIAGFLPVHIGLHYGHVLELGGHLYGSTINLAARIAAKAVGGTILSSNKFIQALANPELFKYEYRGAIKFKNILEKIEILELGHNNKSILIDPVCQMQIEKQSSNLWVHDQSQKVFFCSDDCLEVFKSKREEFLALAI